MRRRIYADRLMHLPWGTCNTCVTDISVRVMDNKTAATMRYVTLSGGTHIAVDAEGVIWLSNYMRLPFHKRSLTGDILVLLTCDRKASVLL